ncbi:MAG: hypothetical protein FJ358_02810 [Thaumarchaeota archaeon]|nr:hypothetical protein [Nitrososphaerota archaeon]
MYLNRHGISKVMAVVATVIIVVGTASAYFFVFQSGAPAQQQVSPPPVAQPAQPAQPPPAQPPPAQPQQPAQPPAQPPPVQPAQPAQPPPAQPPPAQPQQPAQPPAGAADPAKADALQKAIEGHFNKFAARDVPGLMANYIQTGTYAEWKGQAGAFAGKYDGFPRIRILYATIAGNTESMKGIKIENYKADIAGDAATVTMKVITTGRGKLIGAFDMEVEVVQKWVYQNGKWWLQDDRWDFKVFKTEIVAEGTVFPISWRKLGDFSGWNDRIKALFGGN